MMITFCITALLFHSIIKIKMGCANMKRIFCLFLCICMIFILSSCGKVDSLITEIDEFSKKENIVQSDIDNLFEKYENLSPEKQAKITNYSELEKYKDVNIVKVNELKTKICETKDDAPFSQILKIYEIYISLNANEKNLIDITKIEQKMELTDLEKATVSACQYIKKSLKSSASFKLSSAEAINDLQGKSRYYLVKVWYSATNSFGGEIDSTSFQTINEKFENPWYALSFLDGDYSTALKCTPYQQFYLLNEQEPTIIDCEKILYYIDKEI